ncbi:uncharacterized protein LOC129940293 [Eupeodes corollae]|uniref:uncharacterized protein LOC129940293 n=1 Tax=Eupeodes corollae TaxID=290404 RepID=UPI00249006A1|nr:uncharacterized protein LOC129940293 [Eupeodes corollae]
MSSNLTQVKDILSLSLAGKDVLDNYNSNKALTHRQQRQIVQLVIEYYGHKSQRLSTSQLDSIARDIASTFHREDKSTYFIPKSSTYAHPTGILYNAYHNFNRGKTKYRPTSSTIKQDPSSSLPAPEISEEEFEQFKQYLKFNDRPWEIVQEKWEKTAPYRLKEIRQISDKNSLSILNEWPLYKHSGSYLLINIDFQSVHNFAYNKLFLKHIEVNNLLLKYYQSDGGLRNREYKKQLPEICLLDENSRTFPLFNFLSTVITPKQYIKCPGKPGWKVNIKDSEKSFVLRCSQENDILSQVEVEKKKCLEYKIPYQPSIIAVGESLLSKTDFYIYFDGSLLKFNNFISCLDTCFKIFHVFDLEYPKQSLLIWTFIQTYIYEIDVDSSKKFASLARFINNLKKLSS